MGTFVQVGFDNLAATHRQGDGTPPRHHVLGRHGHGGVAERGRVPAEALMSWTGPTRVP